MWLEVNIWLEIKSRIWFEITWFDFTWFEITWSEITWFDFTWFEITWSGINWFDFTWFDFSWSEIKSQIWSEIKSRIWFWNQVDLEVWSGRESLRSGSQSSGSLAGGFSRWNWTCKFSVRDCTTSQLSTMRCGRQSSRTILSTNMAPEPRVETLAWTGCSGQDFMPFAIRSHYATYWPDVEYSRAYVMMPSGVKLSSQRQYWGTGRV